MAGMLRVPRSRGALSGTVLLILGVWGALIPFVGPYFHYAYTPDRAWAYTSGRLWFGILPGVATAIGGLIVLASANRAAGLFGAWLAALAGAWFALGPTIAPLWPGAPHLGVPVGGTLLRVSEQIGFFAGLGVVVVFFAALALGRLATIATSDAALAAARAETVPAGGRPAHEDSRAEDRARVS